LYIISFSIERPLQKEVDSGIFAGALVDGQIHDKYVPLELKLATLGEFPPGVEGRLFTLNVLRYDHDIRIY
jgi:hypothetical protein